MFLEISFFIIGIVLLIKGSTWLVEGSTSLAKKLGVSTLVIGLTIVAFGTSMPELVVNLISSFKGANEIAFGNIIGSNIANILLILGIATTVGIVKLKFDTVWKDIPFALSTSIILFFLINQTSSGYLGRVEGMILLLLFAIFLYYVFQIIIKQRKTEKLGLPLIKHSNYLILFLILGGLFSLYLGGKWTVEGAVFIAQQFGISEFLISSTIIAIGTSLPELITSITAMLKKETDLAVGNIIGSNIFNIGWILGLTAIISPIRIPSFINLDLMMMIWATVLLFVFMHIGKKHELEKWQGFIFLGIYLIYLVLLIIRG